MSLAGKVVIVTGGGRGIGLACARELAEQGARVVIAEIDDKAGAEAVEQIADIGGEVHAVVCDVGDSLSVRNMVATTLNRYERVDALINNAAIIHKAGFLDISEEDFDRVLRVNLKGAFLAGRAVAEQMVRQHEADGTGGAIVNMSSVNAVVAIPDQVPYVVSKGGLNQLTKVMALGLAKYGIRVNAIGPGSVATEMVKQVISSDEARRMVMSRTPLGRLADPAEIADIAAFLISDAASYITGQCLYADGGRLALNLTAQQEETTGGD